jgi:hypothetical protein
MALRGETAFLSGDVCPTARTGRGTGDPVTAWTRAVESDKSGRTAVHEPDALHRK